MAQAAKIRWDNVLTVASATVLVATEALATALAAAWALGGLFNLGDVGEYGLMVLFGLAATYVSVRYFRKAAIAEPLRDA